MVTGAVLNPLILLTTFSISLLTLCLQAFVLLMFLQIKHLVPGGPASVNSFLEVGDVLVAVNSINVLAYTHAEIVSLFQSIPVGSSITLTVSQAYRLRRDTSDNSAVSSVAPAVSSVTVSASDKVQVGLDITLCG